MSRIRRTILLDQSMSRQVPRDWDPGAPWSCVLGELTKDTAFWSEKVHIPAAAWMAAGGRGAPVVASEAAVLSTLPGNVMEHSGGDDDGRAKRKQANRDKRAAKKKRMADEREELKNFRMANGGPSHQPGGKGKGGGKGKTKSKDQAGSPLCFSWASGNGVCAKVAPGGECLGAVKRVHKCRLCLSPSHQDAACPQAA